MSLTDEQTLVLTAAVAEAMHYGEADPISVRTIHRRCQQMRPVPALTPEESEVEDILVTLQHAGMVESYDDGGWTVTEQGFEEEAS
jgi:hypothetical protein